MAFLGLFAWNVVLRVWNWSESDREKWTKTWRNLLWNRLWLKKSILITSSMCLASTISLGRRRIWRPEKPSAGSNPHKVIRLRVSISTAQIQVWFIDDYIVYESCGCIGFLFFIFNIWYHSVLCVCVYIYSY